MSIRGVCLVFAMSAFMIGEAAVRAFWEHDLLRFGLGMVGSLFLVWLYCTAYDADRRPATAEEDTP